jgi:uncharacterized membrane protein YphA (DoxX/SURF4 family)
MRYLKLLSRIILGIVFIFSGFVKAIDPLGSAYKFSDYFTAFKLGFLEFSALPLGVILSAFELVLGIALILGYRRKVVYWVLMWFMSFFTVLTLVLAIFNPVSDCGCFGDALILTNWETFLKNLVLMVFVLALYWQRKGEPDGGRGSREWSVVILFYAGVCWFSAWNYRHIPLLDFRPYDVGTVIQEEMEIPEGEPVDEYETTLTYRNRTSGKESDFSIADYPRDTSEWVFVSSDSRLVRKGFEPPIHDFAIIDETGEDIVDRILADPEYTLLMISCDLAGADRRALVRAGDWSRIEILADDFSFYAVTASAGDQVKAITASLDLDYSFFSGDEIMLKTIVRSNPGFLLLRNGTIIGKWGYRDFPSVGEVDPGALELIGGAVSPLDEEKQLLMEAGLYDGFSFDVLDFDRLLPGLVYEPGRLHLDHRAVIIFILGILLLLLISGFVAPVRI